MKLKLLTAVVALVVCSGAWAGNIERLLLGLTAETIGAVAGAVADNQEAEERLKVQIMLYRFGPECDRLAGGSVEPKSGMCGEVPQPEVFMQSELFAEKTLEQFKDCWRAADELPTGDETIDARGKCKFELEASEREYDAWMSRQDSES